MKKTYSMSKDEISSMAHYEGEFRDHSMLANFWKSMAGQVMTDVLKRVGEDPDKLVLDAKKLNVDFDKGTLEISDKDDAKREANPTIVMANGDPAMPEAPKEAVTEIK